MRELEALGSAMSSHPLNTLSQRYAVYKKKKSDVEMIKSILMEKAAESERMMEEYGKFIDYGSLGKLIENKSSDVEMSEFDLVREFLENSNQRQTYEQSEKLRKEIDAITAQQHAVVASSLKTLQQYFNVVKFYPSDHVFNHRFAKYSQWCRSLVTNKSQEFVRQIVVAFHSAFPDSREISQESLFGFSFRLQQFLVDASYQRDRTLQRYQQKKILAASDRGFSVIKKEFNDYLRSQSNDVAFSTVELAKMLKRLLAVEMSACNASGDLSNLLVNERWYIDELTIQTSFFANISDVIFSADLKTSTFTSCVECFKAVSESFATSIKCRDEFQLTIIPNTLQGIIAGDKNVLEMISALSEIQSVNLMELLGKLQEDLQKCINNPNQKGLLRAAELIEAYNKMVSNYQAMPVDNLGRKIFMLLHVIFEDMSRAAKKILSFDKLLNIPEDWSKITEVEQAKKLFISPMRTTVSMALEQIFLVKRIQAMIEFFSNCLQIALAFKGSGVIVNFDLEFLTHPLKLYVTDHALQFVLGRGSYCLATIICCLLEQKSSDFYRGNSKFSFEQISGNSKFCEKFFSALEESFRKEEIVGHCKQLSRKQSEYVLQLTYIHSAHHWMHEDYFIAQQNAVPSMPRAALLMQLKKSILELSQWQAATQKLNEEVKQCTLIVSQRLKWASGANPMLNELMMKFEKVSTLKAQQLEKEGTQAALTLKHCCSVMNYEMLRFRTSNTVESDTEFLNFLQQWENVCIAERNVAHTVNRIEEALVELLDPEGKIERAWIRNVTTLIDDMINQVHSDIDTSERNVTAARDNLDMCAHKLRGFIGSHHRISADIRNLLKSMLKQDSCDQNQSLRDYLMKYKNFIDNVTELHGNVLSKDFTDVMVKRTIEQVDKSLAAINEIYNDLFTFEKTLSSSLMDGQKRTRNQAENFEFQVDASPKRG